VHFELMVITHVDQDHIDGILNLFDMAERPFTFGDVWFNGWRHLDESDLEAFGPVDGEKLTTLLINQKLPWNQKFARHAVVIPKKTVDQSISLEGGMRLTILSPSYEKLYVLKPKWADACRDAGIDPQCTPVVEPLPGFEHFGPVDIEGLALSPFDPDETEANGSSIAFLAEVDGRKALLTGDAHPDLLLESIKRVKGKADRLEVDAFKLPHHGSKKNISREILEAIVCPRYLISTSGARYKHPDLEAIARVIKFGGDKPELIFNYRSQYSLKWDNPSWTQEYGYSVRYLNNVDADGRIHLS
jgi:hypothetical protein